MVAIAKQIISGWGWWLVVLCTCAALLPAAARPPWLSSATVFDKAADCSNDDELVDLCQRCAKLTKSRLAYPACCSVGDLTARRYCHDYVYFGQLDYDYRAPPA